MGSKYPLGWENPVTATAGNSARQNMMGIQGLIGQDMTGRKKSSGVKWDFSSPDDPSFTYATPNPKTNVTMRWVDDTFVSQLSEFNSTGPIWSMHTPNGAQINERGGTGTNSVPLTNGVINAYIHIIWPTARTASAWRAHNLGINWDPTRVPKSSRIDALDPITGTWIVLDNGPAIPVLTGDTGYRRLTTYVRAFQHRIYLGGDGTNTAQSLSFLDILF